MTGSRTWQEGGGADINGFYKESDFQLEREGLKAMTWT